MKVRHGIAALLAATLTSACEPVAAPHHPVSDPASPAATTAAVTAPSPASGAFTQTAVTGLEVGTAGPNTILEQTSEGTVSGTLNGSYQDRLRVVIHPSGRFNAHFTITCQCSVNGESGVLELVASDRGEIVGPTTAVFAGRAVVRGGSDDLSDLRGVLAIEGTVDLVSGLSTYGYSGTIH